MYVAIEFEDNKEVAIVPIIWLIGTTRCYWPIVKTDEAFLKLVHNLSPPRNKWPLFNVAKILFTEDNYGVAEDRCKLLIAESTSSTSNCDADDEPQLLAFKNFTIDDQSLTSTEMISSSDDDISVQCKENKGKRKRKGLKQNTSRKCRKLIDTSVNQTPRRRPLFSEVTHPSMVGDAGLKATITPSLTENIIENDTPGTSNVVPMSSAKLASILQHIKTVQDQTAMKIDKIFKMMTANENIQNLSEPINLPITPLQSIDDMLNMEAFLQDKDNFKYLVNRLSAIGGTDIRTATMNMMKYLLSNTLASKYNWVGRNRKTDDVGIPKLPFKITTLMRAVYDAIKLGNLKLNPSDLKDKTIEEAVKDWLKQAPARSKEV